MGVCEMVKKLSLEEIKQITVGALRIVEQADGMHFYKCTQKQIDAWYAYAEDIGQRAETSTGVRLDFHTDSTRFAFKVGAKGNYEVYIDNMMQSVYWEKDMEIGTEEYIALDGKEHRITLYLPSHSVGVIEWVQIDEGAMFKPHEYDCKILFFGDSITQGWESTWDSLSYAQKVSRYFNANSLIQGIGGAAFHESTFDESIEFEPDIVIVAYGTNDWTSYATMEEGREHCDKFLDCVMKKYGDKKVFGISPLWRSDGHEEHRMGGFWQWVWHVKEEIQKHGLILIDGEKMVPHLPEFFTDGLHPNAVGFGIYAQNLILEMKKHL